MIMTIAEKIVVLAVTCFIAGFCLAGWLLVKSYQREISLMEIEVTKLQDKARFQMEQSKKQIEHLAKQVKDFAQELSKRKPT